MAGGVAAPPPDGDEDDDEEDPFVVTVTVGAGLGLPPHADRTAVAMAPVSAITADLYLAAGMTGSP